MRFPRSTAVLRQHNFRWYFLARVISTAGSSMAGLALAFAVLSIGGARDLSIVLASSSVSMIAFLLLGGVVADRMPRNAVVQVTWGLAGLCQLVMAGMLLTHTATVPAMAVVAAVAGAASAFTTPAMQGLIPQVTDREYLQEADSLMAFARAALFMVGPAVAGLIVAGPGPAWALVVDGLSFFVAALCFAQVRLPRIAMRASSVLKDLAGGWHEFTSRTWLWTLVLSAGLGNAVYGGAFNVVGAYVAKNDPHLGARGWGLALSAMAVGGLLATVILMRVRLTRPLLIGLIGTATPAIPLLALALGPHLIVLMAATALVGLGLQTFGTAWNVVLQENVPTESLSRVTSYDYLGTYVLGPLGLLVYGWAAGHVDLRMLLLGSAIALLVINIAPLLLRSVRTMGRATVDTEASVS